MESLPGYEPHLFPRLEKVTEIAKKLGHAILWNVWPNQADPSDYMSDHFKGGHDGAVEL